MTSVDRKEESFAADRSADSSTDASKSITSGVVEYLEEWVRRARERVDRAALEQEVEATTRKRAKTRGPSVLTRRIVVINLTGLIVLIAGVLYLNQRSENLIAAHRQSLEAQTSTIAGVLAETAVSEKGEEALLDRELVVPILRRLIDPDRNRALLYNSEGVLIADSNLINDIILRRSLAPPGEEKETWNPFSSVYNAFADFLASNYYYPSAGSGRVGGIRVAVDAGLKGERYSSVRRNNEGQLIVSFALPVQPLQKVLGVLLLEVSDIDAAVRAERRNILRVVAVALAVSFILSIYLAQAIARPIRRLAVAADIVRLGQSGRKEIPDFTKRKDEIGDLSDSMRAMTNALYDRIDAIESFAADVAHEIKNPLTSMRSAVATIELAKSDDQRTRLLNVIQHDVMRIDRLVSDISNASRLDAELARREASSVDIGVLLRTLVDVDETTRKDGDPVLMLDIIERPNSRNQLLISGLEGSLGQVFQNLIDNAKSFSPQGGKIRISARSGRSKGKSFVVAVVEDQGPGIPEENLESIFERFYTERLDRSDFGNHSGLGLSIAKQIVEAHGGTISAENINRQTEDGMQRGKVLGARFIVTFPADESR